MKGKTDSELIEEAEKLFREIEARNGRCGVGTYGKLVSELASRLKAANQELDLMRHELGERDEDDPDYQFSARNIMLNEIEGKGK